MFCLINIISEIISISLIAGTYLISSSTFQHNFVAMNCEEQLFSHLYDSHKFSTLPLIIFPFYVTPSFEKLLNDSPLTTVTDWSPGYQYGDIDKSVNSIEYTCRNNKEINNIHLFTGFNFWIYTRFLKKERFKLKHLHILYILQYLLDDMQWLQVDQQFVSLQQIFRLHQNPATNTNITFILKNK